MRRLHWIGLSLSGVLVLLCGCGGSNSPTVHPPSALSYATATAVYTQETPITANAPTSSGGAVTLYTVSPALPAGLTLSANTGVISGTPTAATATASYTVMA